VRGGHVGTDIFCLGVVFVFIIIAEVGLLFDGSLVVLVGCVLLGVNKKKYEND